MSSLTTLSPVNAAQRDEELLIALLEAGIPISLLMDLASPDPHSEELFVAEIADCAWAC